MLRLLVSSEAVRVSKRLPTHLTAEELFTPTFMDRLVMGSQVKVVTERLPAYSAGVESRWRRGLWLGWGRRLWLGVGVLRLDVLGVGIIGGGAWCLVLAPVLGHATLRIWVKAVKVLWSRCGGHLFHLPFLVEFTVPPEALGVTKLFPTDAAFVILCPGVDCLMLAEVESFSEILPTNSAVMGLLSCVDAIVPAQGLAACKSLTTDTTEVSAWEPTGAHSGGVLPTFGGLSASCRIFLSSWFAGTFWFGSRILRVAAHSLLTPTTSEILIHTRCG